MIGRIKVLNLHILLMSFWLLLVPVSTLKPLSLVYIQICFGIFIFMFSVAIGNLWEVLEFLLDVMFKINCQAGGLNDTMVDMIDGIIGAIISLPFLLRKL